MLIPARGRGRQWGYRDRPAPGLRPDRGDAGRPLWRDHLFFDEYFHGDNGVRIGASNQTGWTAVVATLIERTVSTSPPQEQSQIDGEGRAD